MQLDICLRIYPFDIYKMHILEAYAILGDIIYIYIYVISTHVQVQYIFQSIYAYKIINQCSQIALYIYSSNNNFVHMSWNFTLLYCIPLLFDTKRCSNGERVIAETIISRIQNRFFQVPTTFETRVYYNVRIDY